MSSRRVELTVDELVLVGVDPRDGRRIGAAVERAASEQLAAMTSSQLGDARGSVERFDGGEFRIGDHRDAGGYGQGVAAAITRSIARKV
jgi:hypothetical protein